MAKQRYVDTKMWEDKWFTELTQIEQLVFIYFLTNPMTNIIGAYELSIGTIIKATRLENGALDEILKKFKKDKKVYHIGGWLVLPNFIKHQNYNSPTIKKGIEIEILKVPNNIKSLINIPYTYPMDTLSHLNSNTNLNSNTKSNSNENLVEYFFSLKGWKNTLTGKSKKTVYSRFLTPAEDLIGLCEGNLEEAKKCIKIIADWASSRQLDWSIDTVFKKWYEIDTLKPKEKKPYYEGNRIFEMNGQKHVLMPDGRKLKFNGKLSDITYK